MHYVRQAANFHDTEDSGTAAADAEPAPASGTACSSQTGKAEADFDCSGPRAMATGFGDNAVEPPLISAPVTRLRPNLVGSTNEEPVARTEVKKAFEYAPQQYVVLDDHELRRLRPKTSTQMQILRSVRLAEIDPVYFETSHFVVPDRGGERVYALIFTALQKTEHVALAKVAMHGSEHIVLIRPGRHGLLVHTMYFEDEIRAENDFRTSTTSAGGKELELATAFIGALSAPFQPGEFRDSYREQVQNLITGKVDRGEIAGSGPAESPTAKPVADILEALRKASHSLGRSLSRQPKRRNSESQ